MIHHPKEIQSWFTVEAISNLLQRKGTRCEGIAIDFVARSGHRFRPWITAGVCEALTGRISPDCKLASLAVELVHKASLVHDDIEDGHAFRDGLRTVHAEHGIAAAVNVGDFLIHSSYRLISDCRSPFKSGMLDLASRYQLQMCLGQDKDLCGKTGDEVTSLKTSSAFNLAVRLGELSASQDSSISGNFGDLLGKAYQSLDDWRDSGMKGSPHRPESALRRFSTGQASLTKFLHRVVSYVFPQSPEKPTVRCRPQPIALR